MVRMFVRHKVGDYRTWRRTYDAFGDERASMGVAAHAVYRSADDPADITVSHDFENIRKARAFAASPRLKEVMKGAGVVSAPSIWFVKSA